MICSTRSRVGIFMNKFGKVGFINYVGRLQVDNSLRRLARRDLTSLGTTPRRLGVFARRLRKRERDSVSKGHLPPTFARRHISMQRCTDTRLLLLQALSGHLKSGQRSSGKIRSAGFPGIWVAAWRRWLSLNRSPMTLCRGQTFWLTYNCCWGCGGTGTNEARSEAGPRASIPHLYFWPEPALLVGRVAGDWHWLDRGGT